MIRLARVRPIFEEDLERVLRNARLEKARRGDTALFALEREGEPPNTFGRPISLSRGLERDLLRIRFEGEDESEGREIREPSRRHRFAFGIGVDDHNGRRVLVR